MAQSYSQAKLSNTDIAFKLLQAHGRPMHYRDLIGLILQSKELPQDPEQISAVLTQINLDTRFAYAGSGDWGLKAWVPARGSKRMPSITLMNKSVAYDDEETEKTVAEDHEDQDGRYDLDSDEDDLGDSEGVLAEEDEEEEEDEDEDEEKESEQDRW